MFNHEGLKFELTDLHKLGENMKIKFERHEFVLANMLLGVFACILSYSCQEEEFASVKNLDELAIEISADKSFQEMTKESKDFLNTIRDAIIKNELYGTNKICEVHSVNELNQLLGLPEGYLSDNYEIMVSKSRLIIEKYNLQNRSETENEVTLNNLLRDDLSSFGKIRLKNGSEGPTCQETFEQRYAEIHAAYDNGVWMCLMTAFTGGLTAVATCEMYNVYNACYNVAVAIDNYYTCMGQ